MLVDLGKKLLGLLLKHAKENQRTQGNNTSLRYKALYLLSLPPPPITCIKQYQSLKMAYPMTVGESKSRNERKMSPITTARGSILDLVQN